MEGQTTDDELLAPEPDSKPADTALRAAVTSDYRASGPLRRVALCGVVFWLVYEWGVGNEVVTPWLLARIISDRPGLEAIPAAIFVGFVFTALQQLLAGVTALAGFSMFNRTARAAWLRLGARFGSVPGEWSTLGFFSRCVLVFGLGTTAVALVQITTTGEVGVRRHGRAVTESAVLCGALVGAVAGVVGALAVAGRQVDMLAPFTEWMLRVLGNPLFWLGLVVLVATYHAARNRGSPRPSRRAVHIRSHDTQDLCKNADDHTCIRHRISKAQASAPTDPVVRQGAIGDDPNADPCP